MTERKDGKDKEYSTTYYAAWAREWRRKNPDKYKAARKRQTDSERYKQWNALRARASRAANRQYWITQLGGACVDCGYSDPRALDFDHIDPSTKSHNMSKLFANVQPGNARLAEEAKKCVLRCRNCHQIRTVEENHHGRFRS